MHRVVSAQLRRQVGLVVRTKKSVHGEVAQLGGTECIHEFREETRSHPILDVGWNTEQWQQIGIITSMAPFEITEQAKHQIEVLLGKNPDKYAVSLAVLGGGCAGFKYDWGFADTQESIGKDDHIENWGTGRFVVDETSMLYVVGTKIDFVEETFGSQFEISNPNSTASCGCGESFGV